MLLKEHPIPHRTAPTAKNNLGPNAYGVEVVKPRLREVRYQSSISGCGIRAQVQISALLPSTCPLLGELFR